MQTALIEAFLATPDWAEATIRFKLLDNLVDRLGEEEFERIKTGFEQNDQLYNAAYLNYGNRFEKFFFDSNDGKEVESLQR